MNSINILIVDDREENLITLEALLANRNDITLYKTTSPNEALRIAWEKDIAIAMVDVQMPDMDGFELVELLKLNPKTRDILVIFVTAISKEMKYAVKGYTTGAIDYVYKPLDPYITLAKVDSFIQLAKNQQEIKLKNEELANYAIMVNNSADIICTVDPKGMRIRHINPAIEKIAGHKPIEIIGKSLPSLVIEEERENFSAILHEIVDNDQPYKIFESRILTFDSRRIWVECRASYRNLTLFINISDISSQKQYEHDLLKSKEAAEYSKKVKENFLANMSHELRTPVNGILGIAKMMQQTQLDDQQRGMINLLDLSSQSLLGVINDILDISKIESGKFSIVRAPAQIRNIIKGAIDLLRFKADEKHIDLLLDIDPEIPETIVTDSLRLNQILMNLLGNAIKFTDRGNVRLSVSLEQRYAEKVQLKFLVSDTGIGISPERLPKIFESFEQADEDTAIKYGGTGLGLSIVKKLVELKGGTLIVESKLGKGSRFGFYNWYKSVPEKAGIVLEETSDRLETFDDIRVLIAEDNMVNQFIVTKLFKDWNVQYDAVVNGRKALELLREKNYDLILMDTHMPEMDGYQTAQTIRVDFPEPKRSVPIISLSAAILDHEQEKAIAVGMNAVITKPFQPVELHTCMSNLLRQKNSAMHETSNAEESV
ncbi:MAG: response regulator [Mucilaginibacter polytrichastri]|nr:response regulator [Mucilaginibacter polytrichastri]